LKKLKAFKFECQACGTCCRWGGYAVVYPDDFKNITEFLKIDPQEFADKYCRLVLVEYADEEEILTVPYLLLKRGEDGCIFLDGKRCGIHEVKPYQCERAPMLAEFLLDEPGYDSFHEHCVGIGKGHEYSIAEQKKSLAEQNLKDDKYENLLEENNWDLEKILNVKLPEPEHIDYCGVLIESEEVEEA